MIVYGDYLVHYEGHCGKFKQSGSWLVRIQCAPPSLRNKFLVIDDHEWEKKESTTAVGCLRQQMKTPQIALTLSFPINCGAALLGSQQN
mgnify:CR=1